MKRLLLLVVIVSGATTLKAQLTEYAASGKNWTTYAELSSLGFTRASLQYIANESDSTFLLLMWDQRPEIKSYFTVTFSSQGNTLQGLYGILVSFFEKENWRTKDYTRVFRLGEQKVSVYKSAMIEAKAIIFSTDKGRIQFTKRDIEKLFRKN